MERIVSVRFGIRLKMQTQRFPVTTYTLPPSNISPSLRLSPLLRYNRNSKPTRFCNSLKGISRSQTNSTRCGALFKIRCGEAEVDDRFYMRRCVELARKAIGRTSPNPMVGCVIVKDGKIVGEGFHPKAGQPHAEVFALRDAGDLAEKATAYVSLEPCNHYGRTPPCTEALIKAKVKRVVVGMVDPNPIVASKGLDKLRDAGIDVTVGVEEEMCKKLNEAYIHQMLTGNPSVTLRYSLSANGCFTDDLGEGVSESGGYYSELLQEYDAIILSSSLTENLSSLASQEPDANQPLKIIVAKSGWSGLQAPGFSEDTASKVIVFSDQETTLGRTGIETVVLDRINLSSILEYCKRRGLCSVLLDLRGNFVDLEEILKDGIAQNLLQKIVIEIIPLWTIDCNENLRLLLSGLGNRLKIKDIKPKLSCESIVLQGYL